MLSQVLRSCSFFVLVLLSIVNAKAFKSVTNFIKKMVIHRVWKGINPGTSIESLPQSVTAEDLAKQVIRTKWIIVYYFFAII